MKSTIPYVLLLILTFSCNKNDFSNTEMYFLTDKEVYKINDTFELTILISPKQGEKKIRIFKNLNNLKVSFHPISGELKYSEELRKRFIEGPSLIGDDSKYIDEFTISKSQPFIKVLKGLIYETRQKIFFKIPSLKIMDSIEKSKLQSNSKIIIKGSCHTVYSGKEEYFTPKDIEIVIK